MSRTTKHEFEPEEVMAYLDGELASVRAAALAGHLQHCEECGAVAAQFRHLSERLRDFSVEAAPASTSSTVLEALESVEPSKKGVPREVDELVLGKLRRVFRGSVAWAVVGMAAIVLVVVGVQKTVIRHPLDEALPLNSVLSRESAPPTDTVEKYAPGARGKLPRFAFGKIERPLESADSGNGGGGESEIEAPAPSGPMIAQTVSLTIVAVNYDEASAAIDRLADSHGGYVQKLSAQARAGAARELAVTLRVPATQLGDAMAELRKLGHVEQETRANEEVTDQYVDLQARLKSARATEQRLLQLLATRTGKLEDVLAVEQELARIREEIETMDGQRTLLLHRVNYVTVDVSLRENYHEQLSSGTASTGTGLRNSLVEGVKNLKEGVISLLSFLFAYGPSILFWCALILVPGLFIRRWAHSRSTK